MDAIAAAAQKHDVTLLTWDEFSGSNDTGYDPDKRNIAWAALQSLAKAHGVDIIAVRLTPGQVRPSVEIPEEDLWRLLTQLAHGAKS